jgi:hypothetical protein
VNAPVTEVALPEWVARLTAIGGEDCPWVSITDAQPFLPVPRNKGYVEAQRYLRRIDKERKRRHSFLLPMDALYARDGELPAIREGRSILLPKHLLIVKLLGREP